ncbi:hypothetical protein ACO2Q3_02320 [Caulobacter sp. KR2-114]|uniref:hypothetical protein n=1 Tax=Caulobacter sp. KR2-114 TaxID=3400912 RepID=UPI003C095E32
MPYAAIATVLTGAEDDLHTLNTACHIAKLADCPLNVLGLIPVEAPAYAATGFGGGGLLAAEVWRSVDEHRREVAARIAAMVSAAGTRHGLTRTATGAPALRLTSAAPSPWLTLSQELPLSDMVIVGRSAARADGPWTGLLSDILMGARSPVLLVRNGELDPGAYAAIAWDGSLEAGRAVRAAAPLLRAAGSVTVLQHRAGLETGESAAANPTRVTDYLTQAGCRSVTVRLVDEEPAGARLLEAAQRADARLFVAGAFGHARLREAVLGGATRSFLAAEGGPSLFLCH